MGQLAGIARRLQQYLAVITLYAQRSWRSHLSAARPRVDCDDQRTGSPCGTPRPADSGFQPTGDDRAKALDLVPLLKEHVKLLQRTIPEHIQIELVCDSGSHLVLADPTRIRQVVTNLTVNARDAMPSGGELRIGIEHLQITTRTETPLG